MFVGMVCELAIEQGVPVHWSLPLVTPLPLHSLTRTPTVAAIYLELLPLVHLLVSVGEGLDDQYHLVSLSPTSLITPLHPTLPHTPEPPPHPTPKSFFAVSSLLSLDVEKLCLQHLRTIVGEPLSISVIVLDIINLISMAAVSFWGEALGYAPPPIQL